MKRIKIKRGEFVFAMRVMFELAGRYTGEFRSALAKNKAVNKAEYEVISADLEATEKKRVEILKNHIEFDSDGKPVMVDKFNFKIKEGHTEKLKEEIEPVNQEMKENDDWMLEEIEVQYVPFFEKDIPGDLDQYKYEALLLFCK